MDLLAFAAAVRRITKGAQATAPNAVAIGRNASANAPDAIAVGNDCSANNPRAFAAGPGASANAEDAVAIGSMASANMPGAMALGSWCSSNDENSFAAGYWSSANAFGATALGHEAYANDPESTAIGHGSMSNGDEATAIGHGSYANDAEAVAIGHEAFANGPSSVAIGEYVSANMPGAWVIGSGIDAENPLENGVQNSLLIAIRAALGLLAILGGTGPGTRGKFGVGVGTDSAELANIDDGGFLVGGDLYHCGARAGFFGGLPVTRPDGVAEPVGVLTCPAPGTPVYDLSEPTSGGFGFATADEFRSAMQVLADTQARLNDLIGKINALNLIAPSGGGE